MKQMRLVLLLVAGIGLFAQEPHLAGSSDVVVVDVRVSHGKSGRPIADLKREDFEVWDQGKARTVEAVDSLGIPLDVVFVIGRTAESRRALRIGGRAMVDRLRRDDQAAVLRFGGRSSLLQSWTGNTDAIAEAVEESVAGVTRVEGGARLFDAVRAGLELFPPQRPKWRRRLVVAVSDGIDRGSAMGGANLAAEAIARDTTVNTVVLRSAADAAPKSSIHTIGILGLGKKGRKEDIVSIQPVVDDTGGEYLELAEDPGKLGEMLEDLRARYSVGYRLSRDEQVPGRHAVDVRLHVGARQRYPDAVVRSRHYSSY